MLEIVAEQVANAFCKCHCFILMLEPTHDMCVPRYTLGHPLIRDILLNVFWKMPLAGGVKLQPATAQASHAIHKEKHNKLSRMRGRHRL